MKKSSLKVLILLFAVIFLAAALCVFMAGRNKVSCHVSKDGVRIEKSTGRVSINFMNHKESRVDLDVFLYLTEQEDLLLASEEALPPNYVLLEMAADKDALESVALGTYSARVDAYFNGKNGRELCFSEPVRLTVYEAPHS